LSNGRNRRIGCAGHTAHDTDRVHATFRIDLYAQENCS
jgi:hypothetical protein